MGEIPALARNRIVQHTPKGRAWRLPPPDDPEAKARAVAFLERMGIKRLVERSED